ncbi:MAG: accessory gene regulator B family protein [Lachnospiraceae bacterium]|nr:accessory gene regulator B family protein [Lachnospiraceae bacterium]
MNYIMSKVQAEYGYTDYQIKLIKFSLTAIFYEVSKLLIFMVYFFATGKILEFFFALVPMLPLRIKTGGFHCKSYWSCFLVSFVYFYSVINVFPMIINVHPLAIYPVLLVCAIVDYMIGPTSLKEKAALNNKDIVHKAKIQSFQVVFFVAVLIFVFQDTRYLIVSFWTVVLHTIQLSITKILKEVKRNEKLA